MHRTIGSISCWKRLALAFVAFALIQPMQAVEKYDEKYAREVFDKVYQLVFGPEGASMSYKVDIIGLYKTEGDIIYKGKKVQYQEKRYMSWNDGVSAYMVDKKKKQVSIYRADDDKKDEYLSKFKYDLNDFQFSIQSKNDFYEITAKLKKSNTFGIKELKGTVKKQNLHPVNLRIKVAFFWAVVDIYNFKSGHIDDVKFIFPKHQFKDYEFTDHRKE